MDPRAPPPEFLIQWVLGKAGECAFLIRSQAMLMLRPGTTEPSPAFPSVGSVYHAVFCSPCPGESREGNGMAQRLQPVPRS